jgi:hypothetical protein
MSGTGFSGVIQHMMTIRRLSFQGLLIFFVVGRGGRKGLILSIDLSLFSQQFQVFRRRPPVLSKRLPIFTNCLPGIQQRPFLKHSPAGPLQFTQPTSEMKLTKAVMQFSDRDFL